MLSGYSVEQVFIRPKGGQLEVSLVLVALSGALKHEAFVFPTQNEEKAVGMAAGNLALRPDIESVKDARLRVARQGKLKDDRRLLSVFRSSYKEAREA